jgi:hypothetical protein
MSCFWNSLVFRWAFMDDIEFLTEFFSSNIHGLQMSNYSMGVFLKKTVQVVSNILSCFPVYCHRSARLCWTQTDPNSIPMWTVSSVPEFEAEPHKSHEAAYWWTSIQMPCLWTNIPTIILFETTHVRTCTCCKQLERQAYSFNSTSYYTLNFDWVIVMIVGPRRIKA